MISLTKAREIANRIPSPITATSWGRALLDSLAVVDDLTAEIAALRRLVALAKSYRDCNRHEVAADTTDDEIGADVQAEIDAEAALFDALDAHDSARATGEVSDV